MKHTFPERLWGYAPPGNVLNLGPLCCMLKQIILNSRGGLKPKYHCNLTLITDWNIRKEHSIALYFYHSRPSLSFTWFAAPWKTFKFSIWRKIKILCLSCVVFDFIHIFSFAIIKRIWKLFLILLVLLMKLYYKICSMINVLWFHNEKQNSSV